MGKREDELAVCQMVCAQQFFCGGGIDIDAFITQNGLNTKHFLKIAESEGIESKIVDAIRRNL